VLYYFSKIVKRKVCVDGQIEMDVVKGKTNKNFLNQE